MSAIQSDDESEIINGFGSSPAITETVPKRKLSFQETKIRSFSGSGSNAAFHRRLSEAADTEDNVHKGIDATSLGGGQLYSTESGRLFHAGKICIVLAGLPGRGKTHLSVSLTRYLRWLGVNTHSFHLGDYRRRNADDDLTNDLFMPTPDSPRANEFRRFIVNECVNDILSFFSTNGQVAIYDAVNALPEYRVELHKKLTDSNIQVLFIESLVDNDLIISKNMEEAAKSSPDYANWDYEQAYKDYSDRIKLLTPHYVEMGERDISLSYIKFINFGERIELHNSNYGYLINKVVFFLMNSRIKNGSVYFARCYKNTIDYTSDPPLDDAGLKYSKALASSLFKHLRSEGKTYLDEPETEGTASGLTTHSNSSNSVANLERSSSKRSTGERHPAAGVDGINKDSLVVWTSVKQRTVETANIFKQSKSVINTRGRIQLSQKNPGVVAHLTDKEIEEKFPEAYQQYIKDPYHYRFSRSESYHDLAIKIEPLILEMERMSGDILIIADETVLKVLYGYLMSYPCLEIPALKFDNDEIIEIRFNAYSNTAERIPIEK